jgi:hypothetical protein
MKHLLNRVRVASHQMRRLVRVDKLPVPKAVNSEGALVTMALGGAYITPFPMCAVVRA